MQQNEKAYLEHSQKGETLFNEAAFNQRRALYEGELMGMPFRGVVKTFQVQVWRDLKASWSDLEDSEKQLVKNYIPCIALL